MNYLKAIQAIVKKDILMEIRTKETINASLLFAILITLVFSFIFEPGTDIQKDIVGGIYWMAVIFSGILALNKTMMQEMQSDNFQGLMLSPINRNAIFFGKFISNFIFLVFIEIILIPLFIVFYNINIISNPLMILVIILVTYGYSITGTLFSVISVRTNFREIMLPLLMLPVIIPLILAAVICSNIFIKGGEISSTYNWIKLISVYDIVFTAIIIGIFSSIIEE